MDGEDIYGPKVEVTSIRKKMGRLSVGQQQRLCLARGLAVGPEIILGDEPTSALDPQSSQNVEKRLMEAYLTGEIS